MRCYAIKRDDLNANSTGKCLSIAWTSKIKHLILTLLLTSEVFPPDVIET